MCYKENKTSYLDQTWNKKTKSRHCRVYTRLDIFVARQTRAWSVQWHFFHSFSKIKSVLSEKAQTLFSLLPNFRRRNGAQPMPQSVCLGSLSGPSRFTETLTLKTIAVLTITMHLLCYCVLYATMYFNLMRKWAGHSHGRGGVSASNGSFHFKNWHFTKKQKIKTNPPQVKSTIVWG